VKLQLPTRTCLDQFAEVIPVPGTRVEQREDQQLRGAALELTVKRTCVDT
jgi:hypothetical protein